MMHSAHDGNERKWSDVEKRWKYGKKAKDREWREIEEKEGQTFSTDTAKSSERRREKKIQAKRETNSPPEIYGIERETSQIFQEWKAIIFQMTSLEINTKIDKFPRRKASLPFKDIGRERSE